jgi:hypothetical protein
LTALDYPSLSGTVLPIFLADGDKTTCFCGSGVLLNRGLFLTCWHCVSGATGGMRTVVAVPEEDSNACRVLKLTEVSRDESGLDLATGLVEAKPTIALELVEGPCLLIGHDVWSFGYPFTDQAPSPTGGYDFELNGRILRGYATRTFVYNLVGGGQVESYELDMPVPAGMRATSRQVVYEPDRRAILVA